MNKRLLLSLPLSLFAYNLNAMQANTQPVPTLQNLSLQAIIQKCDLTNPTSLDAILNSVSTRISKDRDPLILSAMNLIKDSINNRLDKQGLYYYFPPLKNIYRWGNIQIKPEEINAKNNTSLEVILQRKKNHLNICTPRQILLLYIIINKEDEHIYLDYFYQDDYLFIAPLIDIRTQFKCKVINTPLLPSTRPLSGLLGNDQQQLRSLQELALNRIINNIPFSELDLTNPTSITTMAEAIRLQSNNHEHILETIKESLKIFLGQSHSEIHLLYNEDFRPMNSYNLQGECLSITEDPQTKTLYSSFNGAIRKHVNGITSRIYDYDKAANITPIIFNPKYNHLIINNDSELIVLKQNRANWETHQTLQFGEQALHHKLYVDYTTGFVIVPSGVAVTIYKLTEEGIYTIHQTIEAFDINACTFCPQEQRIFMIQDSQLLTYAYNPETTQFELQSEQDYTESISAMAYNFSTKQLAIASKGRMGGDYVNITILQENEQSHNFEEIKTILTDSQTTTNHLVFYKNNTIFFSNAWHHAAEIFALDIPTGRKLFGLRGALLSTEKNVYYSEARCLENINTSAYNWILHKYNDSFTPLPSLGTISLDALSFEQLLLLTAIVYKLHTQGSRYFDYFDLSSGLYSENEMNQVRSSGSAHVTLHENYLENYKALYHYLLRFLNNRVRYSANRRCGWNEKYDSLDSRFVSFIQNAPAPVQTEPSNNKRKQKEGSSSEEETQESKQQRTS